ncbi:MAG: hypothetical protein ACREAA_04520 [Candidatus Polarisedimenticolia bacterium]
MSPRARVVTGAAAVVLALLAVPAPLLPPQALAGAVQSTLGVGWKPAYLVTALALHAVLYGSLGMVAAFAVGPGTTRRARLLRLVAVPAALIALAVLIRSLKLGHVPMLSNALVPMTACALGAVMGLLFRQHGWRGLGVAAAILSVGLLWSFFPGTSQELNRGTEAHLRRLVAAGAGLPSGEERFGALLRAAVVPPSGPPPADPIEHNRAAILALGIAIGHERLARQAGLDRDSDLVRAAVALRPGTALREREDWARHFTLSAALAVTENPFLSDTGGLLKEELDALARGTGFSFGDLTADRAGVRFARAATASDRAALAMQSRLRDGFAADDFFPPAADLPENLTTEQFRSEYGGVGSKRYRRTVADIEARLDRCAGLSSP